MDQLRVAVVGVGSVALKSHLPALAARGDVELAYLSRSADAVLTATERFGGTALADDDELVRWRPDAVLVLVADTAHYDVTARLIDRGLPRILVEKPLVAMAGQAAVGERDYLLGAQLLERAAERGTELAMNFNYRSFASVRRAQEVLAERNFGAVTGVSARAHYACWSHVIDLIAVFAGPVRRLVALESPQPRSGAGLTATDLSVSFVTDGGAAGVLLGSAGGSWEQSLLEIRIDAERGSVILEDLDGPLTVLSGSGGLVERVEPSAHASRWDRYTASFAAALDGYLASVRAGVSPPVPARAGLDELCFEAAVRRSVVTGRPVFLAENFPS